MAFQAQFPGCCSVKVLYQFSGGIRPDPGIWHQYPRPKYHSFDTAEGGSCGSGRFVAIIGDHQKEAYDQLCKKYTLESQSHPFMGNHNRNLIVCVFKVKKDKVKK